MKKKIFSLILILALMLSLSATAFAEHQQGASGWYVEFVKGDKLVSNFTTGMLANELSNMQPGDDFTVTVELRNTSGKWVDWYMFNWILDSLEDTQALAENGSYSYNLVYLSSAGVATAIYDSDTVGGERDAMHYPDNDAIRGLKEVESALKNYFFLETMQNNKNSFLTLNVSFEGETQGNNYQNSIADLCMRFAVEVTGGNIVKTGDEPVKMLPWYIGMGATGLLFVVFAATGLRQKKREDGESK